MHKLAGCKNRFEAQMHSRVFRTFTKKNNKIYNIIIIANETAELRSDNSLCCAMYWKYSQIWVTLFFFCPYLGVSNTPYLGSDVTVLHLLLVARCRMILCVSVGRGLWIAFVELLLRT